MAATRVWCLLGGPSIGPEDWAAADAWEQLERETARDEPLEAAYQEAQVELESLDAADDARVIEGFLTDSHPGFGPVLVIDGKAVDAARLPIGTVLQVHPSGELRYWTRESARAATWDEYDAAVRAAMATEPKYAEALRKSLAVGASFSRLTDEEHALVVGARLAGYTVQEGVAWGGRRP